MNTSRSGTHRPSRYIGGYRLRRTRLTAQCAAIGPHACISKSRSTLRLLGGTASKVADLYEAAWTVDRLLALLAGSVNELHLEPRGEDRLGIESYTVLSSGAREYHSIKRQVPGSSSAWTPYQLARTTPTPGRSILGDLFRHLDGSERARAVFVSQDSAGDMREIAERARAASSREGCHQPLSADLQAAFDKRITPVAQAAVDAYLNLQRCEFETVRHDRLVRSVDQRIPALVQRGDSRPADPVDVRLRLSNFAWRRLVQTIRAGDVVSELQEHSFTEHPLAASAQVRARIDNRNDAYTRRTQLSSKKATMRRRYSSKATAAPSPAWLCAWTGGWRFRKSASLEEVRRTVECQPVAPVGQSVQRTPCPSKRGFGVIAYGESPAKDTLTALAPGGLRRASPRNRRCRP